MDKIEEVVEEVPFLQDNEKWAGKIQVLRVVVPQADGPSRTFFNKRLVFTSSGRYINLPRPGVEELVKAILKASELERHHHESLLSVLNQQRRPSHLHNSPRSRDNRDVSTHRKSRDRP